MRHLTFAVGFCAVVGLTPRAASAPAQATTDLIANAGWDCVQSARISDGKLIVEGGAAGGGQLNDYALRFETGPDVTIAVTLEANVEGGPAGLQFWNSLPHAGDATYWYATAPKITLALNGGRVWMAVLDGTSSTPAFQYTGKQSGIKGPIEIAVSRVGDELILRADGAEAARTKVLGPLTGGPLYFGAMAARNKTLTVHQIKVTDGAHPGGAEIVRAASAVPPPGSASTLRAAADARGRLIGVAIGQRPLRWDAEASGIAAREFNLLSGSDTFAFKQMRPTRDQFRFCGADQIVAFAEANKMRVHASAGLLWGELPDWLTAGNFSRDELIAITREHIQTVVGHFKGRVHVWNVVNEVHEFNNTGALAKGPDKIWMRVIGPEYIDMAFRWAHEADPQAILVFNSAGDEGTKCLLHCGPGNPPGSPNRKADALYEFVKGMVKRGVPINAVGMQTHWGALESYPKADPASVGAQMKRLGDLGLDVYVTEMDVPIEKPVTPQKMADQAKTYGSTLRTCLAAPNCRGLIVFGTDDANYSEPPVFARLGSPQQGTFAAPLVFDDHYRPKPAYEALAAALRGR